MFQLKLEGKIDLDQVQKINMSIQENVGFDWTEDKVKINSKV